MLLLILDQVYFFLIHLLFVPKYPSDDERAASTDWLCVAGQDHEVQEDKIVLMSLLMAELGVHSVAYAFPRVKIVTTAVDKSLDDFLNVVPGVGEHRLYLQNRIYLLVVACRLS